MIPAEDPQGIWIIDVPEALAVPVSAGTLTVCMLEGRGLADELLFHAVGTESYDAGRM